MHRGRPGGSKVRDVKLCLDRGCRAAHGPDLNAGAKAAAEARTMKAGHAAHGLERIMADLLPMPGQGRALGRRGQGAEREGREDGARRIGLRQP